MELSDSDFRDFRDRVCQDLGYIRGKLDTHIAEEESRNSRFEAHMSDDNAHGQQAVNNSKTNIYGFVGIVISLISVIWVGITEASKK